MFKNSGRCAYEAERDRRKAAGFPHRAAVVAWEIVRTAGALILGMVIGHSEGCVLGEAEKNRQTAEQSPDCEPGRHADTDAALGALELASQVDACPGAFRETVLEPVEADEVEKGKVALPDIDGGKSGAALVE